MSNQPASSSVDKGKCYAKIGVYCGLVAPMHWHAPYNYWQWPWERHSKPGSDHGLYDVENPIWVDAKQTDPAVADLAGKLKLYKPTAEEKKRYTAALKTPEKAIVDGYKAYLAAKKAGVVAKPDYSDEYAAGFIKVS